MFCLIKAVGIRIGLTTFGSGEKRVGNQHPGYQTEATFFMLLKAKVTHYKE
jgi:hypothetical protein